MDIFYGVVESRADPLKLGRCKVRVIGIHTEDTTVLPTADLPWAMPLMPCNSASTSGIGHSPTGMVEGTWVAVFFRDGESHQEPVIMGTFFGMPAQSPKVECEEELVEPTTKPTSNTLTVENAENATNIYARDSNVLKQTTANTTTAKSNEKGSNYTIGTYTAKMESSGNAGAVNEDVYGYSYGKYQFYSGDLRNGKVPPNSTLMQYINQSEYKEEFTGLTPGTKEFNDKWEEIAGRDPTGFEQSQHDFMTTTQYSHSNNVLRNAGYDLSARGDGVQELIFSTSTQYGKDNTIIQEALAGKNVNSMTDNEIVETVNAYKIATVDKKFRSSSKSVRAACVKRWQRENEAQKELNGDNTAKNQDTYNAKKKEAGIDTADSALTQTQKETIQNTEIASSGVSTPRTIEKNAGDGFKDPFSVYPKQEWLGESEVSRLSRNAGDKIVTRKKNSLCKGVGTANGGNWNEPASPYAPQYPLNHVFQSESGHVTEFDDTPNAERVHIFHRSGSFIEFHPNGDVVYKDVKNKYEITVSDRDIYVGGNCNITVAGDANIYSKGTLNLKSEENLNIQTRGNLKMTAGGSMDIIAGGRANVGALGIFNMAGSKISLNGNWKPSNPDFDVANAGNISIAACEKNEAHVESLSADLNSNAPAPETGTFDEDVAEPEEFNKEEEKAGETCPGGEELNANTKISQYYNLADVTTSCCFPHKLQEQGGLTKCEIFENLSAVATNVADHINEKYNGQFLITSAFRRGSGKSQHYKGEAIDFQFSGKCAKSRVLEMAKIADEICSLLPSWDQMILENWSHCNGTVLHISYKKNGNNRGQKLYSPSTSSYRSVNSFYNFIKG